MKAYFYDKRKQIIKGVIGTVKTLICERKTQEKSIAIKEIKIGQLFIFFSPKYERGRNLYAKG
jgi:hypothetical protein